MFEFVLYPPNHPLHRIETAFTLGLLAISMQKNVLDRQNAQNVWALQ